MTSELIYLDHAATTPLDERVLDAMMPYLRGEFGNAASRQHALGRRAASAVERARTQVAELIGADPREIVFTSGATESNNLALKGVAHAKAYERAPKRFISALTEHHAVLDPLARLEREEHIELDWLRVDGEGHVSLDALRAELRRGVRLVSLMMANNETGLVHPIAEIGALCREHDALLHTDATQAVGKLFIDVDVQSIDLLSLSAHKFGGPKGVGALYLRRKRPRVRCEALLDGGGHEGGVRSGTLNVPGIVGLGAAAALCIEEREADARRMATLRDAFEARLVREISNVVRNGPTEGRLPNIANLSFLGADSESLLARLTGVALSSSSACTSASLRASHVLRALGLRHDRLDSSVRISLGRPTTEAELERAFTSIARAVEAERRDGPSGACSA